MWRVVTACLVLALAGPSLSQGAALRDVAQDRTSRSNSGAAGLAAQVALDDLSARIATVRCDRPEVWNVNGDVGGAARFLVDELQQRGWAVMQHGTAGRTYAIIADPNPLDPDAVAVGGLLLDPVTSGQSVAFLAVCRMTGGPSGGLFTLTPSGPLGG